MKIENTCCKIRCNQLTTASTKRQFFFGSLLAGLALLSPLPIQAEGVVQTGLNQALLDHNVMLQEDYASDAASASLYVDILTAGEVINVSLCGFSNTSNLRVEIYAPSNNTTPAHIKSLNDSNVDCADPMTAPLTDPIRYTTTETGAYRLVLQNEGSADFNYSVFKRYDITVTPDTSTNPDPTIAQGRLWAYSYAFNASGFGESSSTDANYYALIPSGFPNSDYIWKLDLNKFSGYGYNLWANSVGVDSPRSGYSAPINGNTVEYEHPIYLGLPAIAKPSPTVGPELSDVRFIDDDNIDHGISPGLTPGVQDSGNFEFTTNVAGTYSILIDLNQDGIYGNLGDRQLLGRSTVGANQVSWDGTDALGNTVPENTYHTKVQMHLGEYHFIANDVETSGGGVNNGLTIYGVDIDGNEFDTPVYWDDATLLTPPGTMTTPLGQLSGTPAARHTWGNFATDGSGFGNNRYIDTYVYGLATTSYAPAAIVGNDTVLINYDGTITMDPTSLPGDNITVRVADQDLNQDPAVAETIMVDVTNVNTNQIVTLTLIETAPNSNIFEAILPTVVAGATATQMLTTAGDQLEVSYSDEVTASQTTTTISAQNAVLFDSDNDGIPDVIEAANLPTLSAQDSDADGIDDAIDADLTGGADLNGNGIDDAFEPLDSDGDSIPDYLDIDSDNDGIPDIIEKDIDSDGDGLSNYIDPDSDADGIPDSAENSNTPALSGSDQDADGIDDAIDVDLSGGNDQNGNGVDDSLEPTDSDGDAIADYLDIDSDNDGIVDYIEGTLDTDGDLVPDRLDTDSDNDGIPDSAEDTQSPTLAGVDTDADGIDDAIDADLTGGTDADSNGIDDALEPIDTDADGIPDHLDYDSDGDGIADIIEGTVDSDGDGTPDYLDTDSDNDGIDDAIEDSTSPTLTNSDADGDGIDDALDVDITAGIDSDGNGIDDALEPTDSDGDGYPNHLDIDSDADGIADIIERNIDSDGDGIPDYLDLDSDNDAIIDSVEASNVPALAGSDADNDGIDDAIDVDLTNGSDNNNNGIDDSTEPVDTDGDTVADYIDIDSDADGIADIVEGNGDLDSDGKPDFRDTDADGDGLPDATEDSQSPALTGTDTDADGIDNALDVDITGGSDNNGNGIDDALEPTDTDGNGKPDHLEITTVEPTPEPTCVYQPEHPTTGPEQPNLCLPPNTGTNTRTNAISDGQRCRWDC